MRLRSVASALAVLALLLGALVAAAIVWGHERRLAEQEQIANARRAALALEQELGASVRTLTAMRAAVTTDDPERRDELIQLAGGQVRRLWLQGTAWSPVVTRAERAAYERRMDRRIRDLTTDLSRPVAGPRDVYFPIEAGEPRAMFAGFIGVDPGSASEALEAFRAARDSGGPRLSRSAQVGKDNRYLIMALAVYGGDGRPDTTGARRDRLQGFVWTMISGRMLAEELRRQLPDDVSLQLREGETVVGGRARLGSDGARGEVPVIVGGRRYTAVVAGGPASSWGAPAGVAGAGALLAAVVGLLLAAADRRERAATRAVERRLVERARAEAALRASETRFRSVVEAASDAIVLADADGRIVGWNSGAMAMFGYRRDEALGRPLTTIIPERLREAHTAGMAQVAATGRMALLGRTLDLTGLHRDGHEVPVELTLSSWVTEEGRFFSGIMRDVTERNRAEEEIRRQRDYATGLVASLQDGIVVVDGDGTVLEANDRLCEMTGFAAEELLGRRPPFPYHPPEERRRIAATFAAARHGDTDLVFMRRDGTRFPVIVSASPLYDKRGQLTGSVRVVKDVSERERAAREIEAKERFLEAVLESVSEGIVASDAEGTSLLVNRALKQTIGALGTDPSAEEVWAAGDRLRDGRGAPLPLEGMPLSRALAGERLRGVELDFLQDGDVRHILASGGPILDHDGERLGAVVSFHDVTDEKRVERELRAARELFERAFTEAPIGIALVSVDDADFGRFVQVNRALCDITGRDAAALCTVGFSDIAHPEDAGDGLEAVRRIVRGEIPRYRGETRYLRPDGEEVWVSLDASAVRDDEGRALYAIAQIQDVSERRRAGEALRRERDFSRSLVAALQEGVAVVGADGRILDVNPRLLEITGFRREEVIGTAAPGPYWPEDEAPRVVEALASVRGGVPRDLDATMVRADGERFPALVTAAPLAGPGGPAKCVMTFKDMAERLALERMKSEFVALASHELRTPLTSVLGYLELVLDGEAGAVTEEQERLLRVVERSAVRLERLVGDVLLVAQADAGRLRLHREPVDVAAVVRQSVEGARPAAEAAGVALALSQGPLPPILADRDRLAQVLDNLVSNALKFTPRGGRVAVRCAPREGYLEMEVADTGMGIPQEEQDQLFERFYRSSVATRQAIPGTGLGLAIVKTIVEAHDGSVRLESREGRGTTVIVSLPLITAPAAHELQAAGATRPNGAGG